MKDAWTPEQVERALSRDASLLRRLCDELAVVIRAAVAKTAAQYAASLVRTRPELVDDLTQDIGVELFKDDARCLRRWDPARGSALTTYVWHVAALKTITRTTREARKVARIRSEPQTAVALTRASQSVGEAQLEARDELRQLAAWLRDRLSGENWTVFILKFGERLPSSEIGERLGLKVNTIDARVRRIRLLAAEWRARTDRVHDARQVSGDAREQQRRAQGSAPRPRSRAANED